MRSSSSRANRIARTLNVSLSPKLTITTTFHSGHATHRRAPIFLTSGHRAAIVPHSCRDHLTITITELACLVNCSPTRIINPWWTDLPTSLRYAIDGTSTHLELFLTLQKWPRWKSSMGPGRQSTDPIFEGIIDRAAKSRYLARTCRSSWGPRGLENTWGY